jgi:hypothetical protein
MSHMTITAAHVRRLLDAGPDAQLVVREGRADVVPGGRPGDGALAVLSGADLRARLEGHEPSEEMLAELALRLDETVGQLGG